MIAVNFEGSNTTFAADQPEYQPLPAWRSPTKNAVITCWKLSWAERIMVLLGGKIWIGVLTFGQKLQPLLPAADLELMEKAIGEAEGER